MAHRARDPVDETSPRYVDVMTSLEELTRSGRKSFSLTQRGTVLITAYLNLVTISLGETRTIEKENARRIGSRWNAEIKT